MRSERGIALIAVIWALALVGGCMAAIAWTTRSEALATRNALEAARARHAAEAGVQLGLSRLLAARSRGEAASGRIAEWRGEGVAAEIALADEEGKIDINMAEFDLLLGAVRQAEPDGVRALEIACRIVERRGTPEERCPAFDDMAKGAFAATEELRQLSGVSEATYRRLAPIVTVYSGASSIDPRVAPRGALLAVPSLSTGLVDTFMERREGVTGRLLESEMSEMPRDRRWFAVSTGQTWCISAEGRSAGGARRRAEMVVRLTGLADRPYVVLAWREPPSAAP